MIFQEPGTSLNPDYRVGDQVAEAILLHEKVTRAEARKRVLGLFLEVGIPNPMQSLDNYPHEMSGGQKQFVQADRGNPPAQHENDRPHGTRTIHPCRPTRPRSILITHMSLIIPISPILQSHSSH